MKRLNLIMEGPFNRGLRLESGPDAQTSNRQRTPNRHSPFHIKASQCIKFSTLPSALPSQYSTTRLARCTPSPSSRRSSRSPSPRPRTTCHPSSPAAKTSSSTIQSVSQPTAIMVQTAGRTMLAGGVNAPPSLPAIPWHAVTGACDCDCSLLSINRLNTTLSWCRLSDAWHCNCTSVTPETGPMTGAFDIGCNCKNVYSQLDLGRLIIFQASSDLITHK